MQKKNPGDMTAKQVQRRIASKDRRKRRQARMAAVIDRKLKPLVSALQAARTEVERLKREAQIQQIAAREEPQQEQPSV